MKIFLSWSGTLSYQVALELRNWLPLVLQSLEPYVSSEDIDKGARWSIDISRELETSHFGIICVTRDNLTAPWLNFEAGALSKSMEQARVAPFLLGIKRAEVQGPLLQFQSTIYETRDIRKLVHTLNNAPGGQRIDNSRLDTTFDSFWPRLRDVLESLQQQTNKHSDHEPQTASITSSEILEEVLDLVRSQQRLLTSPETLMPPAYLQSVLAGPMRREIAPQVFSDLEHGWRNLRDLVESLGMQVEIRVPGVLPPCVSCA